MGVTTISETFTFFGDFLMLDGKVEELKKQFVGFTYLTCKEKLPNNGGEANIHQFRTANKSVTIRAYRIDFEYGHNSPQCDFSQFTSFVMDAVQSFSAVADLKGHRIAYSNVEFVENSKGAVKEKANKLFNIPDVFGSCSEEIHVRVNHKTTIDGEIYNSVVDMQDGSVTNKQTGSRVEAIFINKDINTLNTDTQARFDLLDAVDYVCAMYREACNRTGKLLKKLGVR